MMVDDEDDPLIETTTTDTITNFSARINSPDASSNRNVSTHESMLFSDEQPLSPRSLTNMFNNSCRKKSNDSTMHSDPSNLSSSSLPGPSSSSDVPGPSTSYTEFEGVDSTDDTDEAQQIRCLFTNADSLRIFDEHSAEILRPLDTTRRNTMNDTDTANEVHILSESDVENEDNNEFQINPLPTFDIDSIDSRDNYETAADLSISADHLFAPEESSNSSTENSPLDVRNSFLSQPNYFRFLTNRQNSADEHSSLRPSPRFGRYIRPPLLLTDLRDRESETPVRLGTTQRLSYLRSRLMNSRFRMRYSHADLFSRPKTTSNLSAVASNDDGENMTTGNDLRELNARPYRRNLCSPKFHTEPRFHSHVSPSECDSSIRCQRISRPDRPFNSRSAIIRSIIDIENSLIPFSRPSTSNIRARSVSPTSASPNVSASVHDEPLDDIGINLRSDNIHNTAHRFLSVNPQDEIPRPGSPLPPVLSPTLSDDDMELVPLTSSNIESEILTTLRTAQRKQTTCSQPMNLTMNLTDKHSTAKEAPRTYEDLNSELIQLLECPICFEFTTPPINQCLQGHIICNNCRQRVTTCPTCRTIFQESRNLVMEKVAALLRYPCKNAVTGCMEFLYLLQKEQHEMSCGFRQYACFLPVCNWRGYKPELLVHVQETHENHVIHGPSTNLLIPVSGQTKKVWLMSAFNELFYVIFFTTLGILKGCVRFIGDCSKCDCYTYNISVTSEEDMLRNFNFTRTTHAYEENFENTEMIDSYDLFSISHAQLNLFRKGTKAPVRITIEEAQKRTSLTAPTSSNIS